jgi:hypothetical protein
VRIRQFRLDAQQLTADTELHATPLPPARAKRAAAVECPAIMLLLLHLKRAADMAPMCCRAVQSSRARIESTGAQRNLCTVCTFCSLFEACARLPCLPERSP